MSQEASTELSINGEPPELVDAICQAFICEHFVYEGDPVTTANVSYLKFSDVWHRLYFDCGIIFWRKQNEAPLPRETTKDQWSNSLSDVGEEAGIIGHHLISYHMMPTSAGSKVEFLFEHGCRIVLEDINDVTNYSIFR